MKTELRIIRVRLSDAEYELSQSLCRMQQTASISGLFRSSIQPVVLNGKRTLLELLVGPSAQPARKDWTVPHAVISNLEQRLAELDRQIGRSVCVEPSQISPASTSCRYGSYSCS